MTITRNPFDAGGYSLAEMTQAINILPNLYTRLGQIGLFRFQGVTQRSIIIEQREGVLSLLPSVPLGAPATVGNRAARSMRSFALPWIPHDDVILPNDIQGVPMLGRSDAPDRRHHPARPGHRVGPGAGVRRFGRRPDQAGHEGQPAGGHRHRAADGGLIGTGRAARPLPFTLVMESRDAHS